MIFSNQLEEEEEEEEQDLTNFEHWNNWNPTEKLFMSVKTEINKKYTHCEQNKLKFPTTITREIKFGNWHPPTNLVGKNKSLILKSKLEEIQGLKKKVNLEVDDSHKWRKVVNEDWGERVELHDILSYDDRNMLWGYVSLSTFTSIKLWINNYNNVCGCANGILFKPGSSKKSFIITTDLLLLKKILNVTNSQWCSLCEAIQQSKVCLKVENLKPISTRENSFLDKLWFFICNRRHFSSKLSMLVKLDGTTCMKGLTVIPKLVVRDIRNVEGHLIS